MKAFIKKISYYIPNNIIENTNRRLAKKTGIYRRHICSAEETASDMAVVAANRLFNSEIERREVEFVILCTQSADYYLPTTACILQERLGLNENCGAYDFNLGCSGYIYGLSMAKGLIETGQVKNVLLLTAETYSKYINKDDNSVLPLFGDAAAATFIEGEDVKNEGLGGFVFGTRGSLYDKLIVPCGGARNRYTETPEEQHIDDFGNKRTNRNLFMDGAAISDFALDVVPATMDKILANSNMQKSDIDFFVFHQANKFMLDYLRIRCDLMDYPYWNDVNEYGNTVSCSIPIALLDMWNRNNYVKKVMSIGFGVGLSWAGCIIDLSYLTGLNCMKTQ